MEEKNAESRTFFHMHSYLRLKSCIAVNGHVLWGATVVRGRIAVGVHMWNTLCSTPMVLSQSLKTCITKPDSLKIVRIAYREKYTKNILLRKPRHFLMSYRIGQCGSVAPYARLINAALTLRQFWLIVGTVVMAKNRCGFCFARPST